MHATRRGPRITRSACCKVLLFAVSVTLPPLAVAQQGGYGQWAPPAAAGGADHRVQQMVDKLRSLIHEAEQARAADPRFLRDLRRLAASYDWPWRHKVLHDDFSDGDYTRDPTWTVTSGQFRVDPSWGLSSEVPIASTPDAAGSNAAGGGQESGKDVAAALIGGLLNRYVQGGQAQGQGQVQGQESMNPYAKARIQTRVRVSNAFALAITLSEDTPGGHMQIALERRDEAYRLQFSPDGSPALQLSRSNGRGDSVIDVFRGPITGGTGATHRLLWTRDGSGQMNVSLDGQTLISTTDRALRGSFDDLALANLGGEFTVRQVDLSGVR